MTSWREQLAEARAQARARFQGIIDYIKDQIGPGLEYENALVRVVLSERGCYYEFREIPEEFSGAVGSDYSHEFVNSRTGHDLVEAVDRLIRDHTEDDTRELSLLAIYDSHLPSPGDSTYVYHYRTGPEAEDAMEAGRLRLDALPAFLKLKVDSDLALPLLGARRGLLFFVADLTDRHLLVLIPHKGLAVSDLSDAPEHAVLN